eukprot:gene20066-6080_t
MASVTTPQPKTAARSLKGSGLVLRPADAVARLLSDISSRILDAVFTAVSRGGGTVFRFDITLLSAAFPGAAHGPALAALVDGVAATARLFTPKSTAPGAAGSHPVTSLQPRITVSAGAAAAAGMCHCGAIGSAARRALTILIGKWVVDISGGNTRTYWPHEIAVDAAGPGLLPPKECDHGCAAWASQ